MTEDLHHLAAAYALDALTDEERREFEAYYPTSEIARNDVAEFRAVATTLAGAVAEQPPGPLRDAVLARIGETRQLSPLETPADDNVIPLTRRRLGVMTGAAAAALLLIVAVASLALRPNDDAIDDVIAAPDAIVAGLDRTDVTSGDGTIQVIWSAQQDQVAILANRLAPVDDGFEYALWFLLDDGVAPAGLFEPDQDGTVRAVLDVDDLTTGGWGITVEPAGGSPQPTTEVLFAGEL